MVRRATDVYRTGGPLSTLPMTSRYRISFKTRRLHERTLRRSTRLLADWTKVWSCEFIYLFVVAFCLFIYNLFIICYWVFYNYSFIYLILFFFSFSFFFCFFFVDCIAHMVPIDGGHMSMPDSFWSILLNFMFDFHQISRTAGIVENSFTLVIIVQCVSLHWLC